MRVLIVDDNHDFASLLGYLLGKNHDIEVSGIANNGIQAWTMVQQIKPDVLLLDLIMPNIDGFSTLQNLLTFPCRPKIFIVSAVSNESIKSKALSMGASGYFVKPVNIPRLMAEILEPANGFSHELNDKPQPH